MSIEKLYEKHNQDIRDILIEEGCIDKKGRMIRWKGREVVDEMIKKGHSSLDFHNCHCRIGDKK